MSNQNAFLPIAAQLYSLRHLPLSLDEMLGKVAAIGYSGVETSGDHGISASQMDALLRKHQLRAVSAHFGLEAMETNLDEIITFSQTINSDTVTIPGIPQEMRPSDGAGFLALGRRLGSIGQKCAVVGMRLLYHNHDWEMVSYDGKPAIDWLLEGADPAYLQWEPDLAWIVRGGADAVALLQRHAGRCPLVHAKDLAPEGQNEDEMGFADVGYGTMNWETLLSATRAAGVEWYIVEHDLPKDPVESVRRSFMYLQDNLTTLNTDSGPEQS